MGALKEAVRFYRTERRKEYLKRQLLSRKTDFHLLEQLIQDVNENPDLRIEVRLNDATVFDGTMEGMADVVIADVPCSGLGVMGRKNDIKYNLTEEAVGSLVSLQRSILTNAVRYLRPGGRLMFSTCTCSREENEGNRDFLIKECRMKPVDFYDLLPDMLKDDTAHEGYLLLFGKDKLTDGFFLAGFTN
jgi:16S rRNA (cytosine967-C5)-methyltransferase